MSDKGPPVHLGYHSFKIDGYSGIPEEIEEIRDKRSKERFRPGQVVWVNINDTGPFSCRITTVNRDHDPMTYAVRGPDWRGFFIEELLFATEKEARADNNQP